MATARHIWGPRAVLLGTLLILMLIAAAPDPAAALYLDDEHIPGKPFTQAGIDTLATWRTDVVHRIYLRAGQDVTFRMIREAGTDFDLLMYGPDAVDFATPIIDFSVMIGAFETMQHNVAASGWYYVRVRRNSGTGNYTMVATVEGPTSPAPPAMALIYGPDRYETAVRIAEQNFPNWRNCDHVIIASGEDRAAADPLSASGLSWAYGAPILLVQSDSTPRVVIEALQEIRARNGPFHLHVVGGPVSVGRGALDDIEANVANVIYDRLEPYDDRYTLAASIATRMEEERPDDHLAAAEVGAGYQYALIANGEDPGTFFDALALGPVSAASGHPVLLVGRDYIPAATARVLDDLDIDHRFLAGGPATVSSAVEQQLGAGTASCTRYWGPDRYATAVAVNQMAEDRGILSPVSVGIAAKLPDALSGGSYMGLRRGEILLTQSERLPSPTRQYLGARSDEIDRCYILGGPVSIEPQTRGQIGDALNP